MKRLLVGLLVVTGGITAAVVYEQLFVDEGLGPAAILAVLLGAGFFVAILATLLVYETRHRETAAKLWLAAVSVAVSYLLFDVLAGFLLIRPLSPPLAPDEYRHHKLVPNSYSQLQQRDFSYVQRVNNFGLRGPDVAAGKPPDTYRILMLGDSFTMGKGVEDNETFSALLQESLNRRLEACDGGTSLEILNAGVDGYAPILSFIQLTRELHVLEPDMVVLNLDMNDLVGEAVFRRQAVHGENGEIVGVPLGPETTSPVEKIRSWSERHLFLTRLLLSYVNELFDYRDLRLVTQANFEILAHTLAQDATPREEQWRDLFASIMNIKGFADARGMEFLLSTYPHAHQVNEREGIPGRYGFVPKDALVSDKSLNTIRQFALDNGLQFVDLFPAFRAHTGDKALYFHYDTHWTPAGHEVMAGGLEAHMLDRYWNTWCGRAPSGSEDDGRIRVGRF